MRAESAMETSATASTLALVSPPLHPILRTAEPGPLGVAITGVTILISADAPISPSRFAPEPIPTMKHRHDIVG